MVGLVWVLQPPWVVPQFARSKSGWELLVLVLNESSIGTIISLDIVKSIMADVEDRSLNTDQIY